MEFIGRKGELSKLHAEYSRDSSFVVIYGRRRVGKTTLIKLLMGLYPADKGQILIDGVCIEKIRKSRLYDLIGMVMQDNFLFNMSIRENLLLANESATEAELVAACKKANIYDFVMSLPNGFDTEIGERGVKLSGGQKQRVAIAGVVAMEPKCIVMDEPTAMLDPVGRREVLKTVHKLRKQKKVTVILITHYMEEVVDADKIFVMDHGKVVMEGSPKEIFSKVDELKSYRLDVPQVTILADELRKRGLDIPKGILRKEELVEAVERLISENGEKK